MALTAMMFANSRQIFGTILFAIAGTQLILSVDAQHPAVTQAVNNEDSSQTNHGQQHPTSRLVTTTCNSTQVETSQSGFIRFPAEGTQNSNVKCSWLIHSSQADLGIELTIQSENFGWFYVCSYNAIELTTLDDTHLQTFCGYPSPSTTLLPFSNIKLTYTRSSGVGATGFYLNYTFRANPCLPQRTESPIGGSLQYPIRGEYPNNVLCTWEIGANVRQASLLVALMWMDIENNPNCDDDVLGFSMMNGTLLHIHCGRQNRTQLFAFAETAVKVTFSSDKVISGQGFYLEYSYVTDEAKCLASDTVSSDGGSLHYPSFGYYPFQAHCNWTIEVNQTARGMHLTIHWRDIAWQSDSTSPDDALTLGLEDGTTLYSLYGSSIGLEEIEIPLRRLKITFTSHSINQGMGFYLTYTGADDSIPFIHLTNKTGGSIVQPWLDSDTTNKSWSGKIGSNRNDVISINIDVHWISAQVNSSCSKGSLTISTGDGTLLQKICGSTTETKLTLPYDELLLTFNSPAGDTGLGFQLEYEFDEDTSNDDNEMITASSDIARLIIGILLFQLLVVTCLIMFYKITSEPAVLVALFKRGSFFADNQQTLKSVPSADGAVAPDLSHGHQQPST